MTFDTDLFHQEVGAGEGPRGHRCTSRRTVRARSWGTTPGGFPGSCGAPCRSPPPDLRERVCIC